MSADLVGVGHLVGIVVNVKADTGDVMQETEKRAVHQENLPLPSVVASVVDVVLHLLDMVQLVKIASMVI